jgi:hypothetical protein
MSQSAHAVEAACATAIFCEDWEGANPLGTWPAGLWFENNQPQNHAITTTPANVYSGTHALETTWSTAQGGSGAGWLTRWFNANGNDATPVTGYDHIFARVYVKYEAGLQCDQNCPKLFVLNGNRTDNAYSSFGQAGTCPNGTDWFYAGTAQRQPPPSANRDLIFYDYDAAMPCPPGAFGQEINMTPTQTIPLDTWTCIESEVQTNTVGQSNGIHRTWVNDVLAGERTNVRWRDTTNLKLNSFQLSFSGGVLAGANHIWYDNIVVSQQRVSCSIAPRVPPTAPSNLRFGTIFLPFLALLWALGRRLYV